MEEADAKLKAVQRRLSESIAPPASVTVEDVEGKKLIVIDVPQGLERPYVCKGRIMVRRGTAVGPAVAGEISSLIGQRAQSEGRWERLPALGVEEDDLDADLIRRVAETTKERKGYDLESAEDRRKTLDHPLPQPPEGKPSPFRHAQSPAKLLVSLGPRSSPDRLGGWDARSGRTATARSTPPGPGASTGPRSALTTPRIRPASMPGTQPGAAAPSGSPALAG